MNKLLNRIFAVSLAVFMASAVATAEIVKVDTKSSSMVLDATKGKKLKHLYYGANITDADASSLKSAGAANRDAYPDYGLITVPETALSAVHSDGNMTLDLRVDGVEHRKDGKADPTVIRLKDAYYPFTVNVNYRT